MSFARTYAHTVLVGLDDLGAAILFNRDDVTISSLCGLQRRADAGKDQRIQWLDLHGWQVGFLRGLWYVLEWIKRGHCEAAITADRARGASMQALLE